MEPCNERSFYDEMETALTGAEGLREDWLLDYAQRAEMCSIDKAALVSWIDGIAGNRP